MLHAPTEVGGRGEPEATAPIPFGDMELLRLLSSDDRGDVYVATWPGGVDKLCAVNLLAPGLLTRPESLDNLKAQASWLVRRFHGNLVQVYDVGEAEGRFFYASELVDGRDLSAVVERLVERQRALPPELAVHIVMEVALALEFIRGSEHKATGLHTSPVGMAAQSVLLGADGAVKVMHYGSSLAPTVDDIDESMIGRASLVAPECAKRNQGTSKADVFAVGALLWQCLSGKPMAAGAGVVETFRKMRTNTWKPEAPGGSEIDQELQGILKLALHPELEKRPENATLFRARLSAYRKARAWTAGKDELRQLVQELFAEELAAESAERTLLAAGIEAAPRPGVHHTLTTFDGQRRRTPVPMLNDLPVGEVIKGTRYRVLAKLGEGGMGAVYAAEHVDIERRVALKLLHAEFLKNPAVLQQFRQEARAASRIGNPNICDVTDWGEVEDGRVFFVMEYLDGVSLGREIRKARTMEPGRVIPILRQICKALGAAHDKGIVHLDMKPDNVFLMRGAARADSVKVFDFGIAGLMGQGRATGKVMGTPEYMAPERTRGRNGAGADIYALGVMAYEMLAGEVPFQGGTPVETLAMHSSDTAVPFRERLNKPVPASLESLVFRLMDKDPDTRPQTMEEVERQLLEAQAEIGVRTPWDDLPMPDMPHSRAERIRRRLGLGGSGERSRGFVLGAVGITVVATAIAAFAVMREREVVFVVSKDSQQIDLPDEQVHVAESVIIPAQGVAVPAAKTSPPTSAAAPAAAKKVVDENPPPAGAEAKKRPEGARTRPENRKPEAGEPEVAGPSTAGKAAAADAIKRGQAALAMGRLKQAAKEFEEGRKADPGQVAAIGGLAEVAFEEADYRRAASLAREALRLAPGRSQYLIILADAHYKLGELDQALAVYQQALALKPDSATLKRRVEQVEGRIK